MEKHDFGWYYSYLVNFVKENVFKGNISISCMDKTDSYDLMDVKLVRAVFCPAEME